MKSSWIKWIGLLILPMMAVRVSITPGVLHRHQHGDHPHSHHHSHSPHAHARHFHSHEPREADTEDSDSHIHLFVFGWELTLNIPFGAEETTARPEAVSESSGTAPQVDSLPYCPQVTAVTSWGTLIQWVFDLRSPTPPAKLKLPNAANVPTSLPDECAFAVRDRDKPLVPPPESGVALLTVS